MQGRNVLMFSVHPPKKSLLRGDEMALRGVTRLRAELEEYLSIPTCLEVMPNNAYWLSMGDCLWIDKSVPLLLDLSHINIWAQGKEYVTKRWVEELLPQAMGIHLSHNNGKEDSHDLIPKDIWFNPYIKEWAQKLFVTYESLPEEFAEYERLDKKEKKCLHLKRD
jgi:hypothetical protein